ncbi:MAG: DegT/DnrJ/EryC1/StrS family aminotransferase [Proteobacteria bacterium]|nr:DegT/DnrJ/EryC1/StrS family aminotransferase [Pseudomonadota bacterium]MBI3497170.1 DegT/DnrJ/EryC1/StrS family aminotransferase [Pseudomonadota bacterium]
MADSTGFITPLRDIPWWRTEVGEEEVARLLAAVRGERISAGALTLEFESALALELGVAHAVCTTSGTSALLLSLMAIGVGRGDEVIVPARTFIATAHAAYWLGAEVVLADCLLDSPNLDTEALDRLVTPRTKVIMPVHLNGRAVDMDRLLAVARPRGIAVVEDAAQALFSRDSMGRHLGTIGDAGCYSFGMTKLVSTGQGGAVVTNRADLAKRLRLARNHGVEDLQTHEYLVPGLNFKFTDLQAAVGLGQLASRTQKVERSLAIYRAYESVLQRYGFVRMVPVDVEHGEVPLWVEVASPVRERLMTYLAEKGVQTRRFLPCLDTAPHFRSDRRFANSARFHREGFILPCGPAQPIGNVARVAEILQSFPA